MATSSVIFLLILRRSGESTGSGRPETILNDPSTSTSLADLLLPSVDWVELDQSTKVASIRNEMV